MKGGTSKWIGFMLAVATAWATAVPARAASLTLLLGPGNAGNGGSNPLGIPPGATDIAIKYLSANNTETTVSIVPGILYGKRFDEGNFYVSIGGGALISASGLGLGAYSSFGYVANTDAGISFTAEYTQTLGANGKGWTAPGAGRLGAIWKF